MSPNFYEALRSGKYRLIVVSHQLAESFLSSHQSVDPSPSSFVPPSVEPEISHSISYSNGTHKSVSPPRVTPPPVTPLPVTPPRVTPPPSTPRLVTPPSLIPPLGTPPRRIVPTRGGLWMSRSSARGNPLRGTLRRRGSSGPSISRGGLKRNSSSYVIYLMAFY